MLSTGPTIAFQGYMNEKVVRDSRSGAGYDIEIHSLTLDGSGAATLETDMDKPKFAFTGVNGTAAGTAPIAVDLDNATQNATTDRWQITVNGDANAKVFVQLWGYFVGE